MRLLAGGAVTMWMIVQLATAPDVGAVRVWAGTLQIPTYAEGPANPNPPFDLFSFGRFNYPYPIRDALTDRRDVVGWRTLNLENEYLRLTVLPDLGGHVYSCLDKRTGREMFYANTAIKKALIGYRGAWAAFGVEFNFPVSHNWVSMSPVDFATAQHPDGSASIWVGNSDQVYRSRWRVELRLRPARTALEQHTELYNQSDVRHRYYWWNNAAVQVWEDSRLEYPTEVMATHGFTSTEPWPIDRQGRNLSVIRNQTDGPVSLFTHRTREGFVGVYHPHTNSGTAHVASPDLPAHKVWSWGYDRDAAAWRSALSDDDSAYVELQSGLFRNQETYAFLEPQESVRFSEYWLPVRDLGGITRATADGVLHMERTDSAHVKLALDVAGSLPGARIVVRRGSIAALDSRVTLSPRDVWRAEIDAPATDRVTFELADQSGGLLLRHIENTFDLTPASQVHMGPQVDERASSSATRSAEEIVEGGQIDELEGRRLSAIAAYRTGLELYPAEQPLLKAAGRIATALGWPEATASSGRPNEAIQWLEAALARNTTDFETEYYLGLALASAGRSRDAQQHLQAARRFRATSVASGLQLARIAARSGDAAAALGQLDAIASSSSRAPVVGALEIALLRRLGRAADARTQLARWRGVDPTSSLLRYEGTLLGEPDAGLWTHLGADANRVLDLVDQYLCAGDARAALGVLDREYPPVEAPLRENGAVSPKESPLVAYYRGYVRQQLGESPRTDYDAARALPTTYVFPNRPSSYAVLESALQANPGDATARFLLGAQYLAGGLTGPAVDAWQTVRHAKPAFPTLHRNLGLALLHGSANYTEARAVLQEGIEADPTNVEVYLTLDGVLSAEGAAPQARVAALRRYPAPNRMPAAMVFGLALALAEAGNADEAERLFHDRFFPREEGGTSVRAVYSQVRLSSARAAADTGDCPAARAILDSFTREQASLPFTAGGLDDTLAPPTMARQVAGVESACGRAAAARARWERLSRPLASGGSPVAVAVADEARRRLGRPRSPAERRRIEEALAAAARTLETGGTSNPGLMEYGRASLLAALGRTAESRRSLQRVFVYPDRNLSHAVARAAR
jgi:tetratricopeptide (TPR) repeat protein